MKFFARLSLLALCMALGACATITTPPVATKTPQTCPFGSTTFTMQDTTRMGCAIDRFTVLNTVNASWAGVDTISVLNTTTERSWDVNIVCPLAVGAHTINNQVAPETTLSIDLGQTTYKASDGTITITEATSAMVTGSFSVTAGGFPVTGTFSFVPS